MALMTLVLVAVVAPTLVGAQGLIPTIVPRDCNGSGGCQSICDLASLAQNLLNAAVYIAVIGSAILFMITGFRFATAQARGESVKMSQTRGMLINVFFGLVIILAAWLIVNTIVSFLVTGTGGLPWHQICSRNPNG